ncbi:MAG TPA: GtrA family protein [Streptosporangiaceae bacterium]|jgi:putative flippase GtrA
MGFAGLAGGRARQLVHELAKFGIIGGVSVLIAAVGTNLLHFRAGMGPLTANVIATVVSTVVSYLGNRYWTFRNRQRTNVSREGVLFFVLNGLGLAIQLACLGFSTYVLHLHGKLSYNVFLVIGIGLGTVFRYAAYKKWVWRVQPSEPEAPAQPYSVAGPPAYWDAGAGGSPSWPDYSAPGDAATSRSIQRQITSTT